MTHLPLLYAWEVPEVLTALEIGLTPYRNDETERIQYLGNRVQFNELYERTQGYLEDEVHPDQERWHLV